jgi:hypothetical protein
MYRRFSQTFRHRAAVVAIGAGFVLIAALVACSPESGNTSGTSEYGTKQPTESGAGGAQDFQPTTATPTGGFNSMPVGGQAGSSLNLLPADEEDAGECGSVTVEADVEIVRNPGNLLVIFDRSQSMAADWNGQPRYEAASQALIGAIEPLQELLTVGGQFFPSLVNDPNAPTCDVTDPFDWIPGMPGDCLNPEVLMAGLGSCNVTEITADDQLNFRPASQFVSELPNYNRLPGEGMGMTPLEKGVVQADAALATANLTGPIAVVIMTDGEPNCDTDVNNVNNIIAGWSAKGIKTYVVGLPGSQAASGILNQLAQTGGTDSYIEPNDPAALQAKFETIVSETVKQGLKSCVITLQRTENADTEKLVMVVVENGAEYKVPRDMGNGSGWSVNAEGTVATLQGALCEEAKGGRFESVSFSFGCVELPILIE